MNKSEIMSGYEKIFDDGYEAGRGSVVLPHPCNGPVYDDWGVRDYLIKLGEECGEVFKAYKELMRAYKSKDLDEKSEAMENILRECADVQVAATSLMDFLGCGDEGRQEVMREINESNAKRDGGKRFKKHPLDEIQERLYKVKTFSASSVEEKQEEEKTKHDEEDFETGEVVKVDCVSGEKGAIVLGKSKAYPEEYDISVDGYYFVVPRGYMKKVER